MSLRPGCFNYKHYYSMKKKSAFHSIRRSLQQGGFSKLRVLFGVLLCFAGVTIVLLRWAKPQHNHGSLWTQRAKSRLG